MFNEVLELIQDVIYTNKQNEEIYIIILLTITRPHFDKKTIKFNTVIWVDIFFGTICMFGKNIHNTEHFRNNLSYKLYR